MGVGKDCSPAGDATADRITAEETKNDRLDKNMIDLELLHRGETTVAPRASALPGLLIMQRLGYIRTRNDR